MAFMTLHDRLRGPIAESLKTRLKKANTHALPRITKVVVNVGINRSKMDSKEMQEYIVESLKQITGQKPVLRAARKAVSNFKIREGLIVGAMVTLRGKRMEAFLDKLLHVALPRVRDFRGIPSTLDGHGNYSVGLKEHTVFPEVAPPSDASRLFGLEITIATTAGDDASARALFEEMKVPFRKEKEAKEAKKIKE
ncbi:MAG TPA: 50S ribosomal protein L5 [Candidatus Peribacterales bacterium]|nr:50S ribosomal protein L5 [Candidatus Peribacterales bacterium]